MIPFGLLRPQVTSNFIQYGRRNESEFTAKVNDGYIPIATASEFNNLRTTVSQTMGLGSPFEGIYTTGLDKKYIMYIDLDLISLGNFTPFGTWSGDFLGNEVDIINLSIEVGSSADGSIFGDQLTDSPIAEMRVFGDIEGGFQQACYAATSSGTITNCHFTGTVTGSSILGGICGAQNTGSIIDGCVVDVTILAGGDSNGGITGRGQGQIINCVADGTITSTLGNRNAGICGDVVGDLTFTNNISSCDVNGRRYSGGAIGFNNTDTLTCSKSYTTGTITGTDSTTSESGGFIGWSRYATIDNCYSLADVIGAGARAGGFIAVNLTATTIITNCYSIGSVTGATTNGGFCALNTGTITNSYWDTVASGNATSDGATGKTTTEMQQGLIPDTAIYIGWSPLIWDAVDLVSYPILRE